MAVLQAFYAAERDARTWLHDYMYTYAEHGWNIEHDGF